MKFNKYYLMSAVFCMALASCSDDVVDDQGGKPDTEQTDDVKDTYASFSFNFTGTSSRAAIAREVTEVSDNEAQVKDCLLLVFKNEEGSDENRTLELCVVIANVTAEAGTDQIASTFATSPYLISSGHKKVFAVLNASANGLLTKDAGDTDYKLAGQKLLLNKTLLSEYETWTFAPTYATDGKTNIATFLGGQDVATNGLLMTGANEDVTLESGKTTEDPNTVTVGVDRASAKVTVGVNTTSNEKNFDSNKFIVPATNKVENPFGSTIEDKLGTIGTLNYAMFNLNTAEYLHPQLGTVSGNDNIFQDPNYAYSTAADLQHDTNVDWYHQNTASWNKTGDATQAVADFYTAAGGTTSVGQPVALTGTPADGATATNPSFIPENTNQFAVKGNTTYAMLEAVFVPETTRSVDLTDYIIPVGKDGGATSLLFKQADKAISGSFLYCEDYGVFFGIDGTGMNQVGRKANGGSLSAALFGNTNLKVDGAVKAIAAKMISDANIGATGSGTANAAKSVTLSDIVITTSEPATTSNANKWIVKVEAAGEGKNLASDASVEDNARYFKIAEIKLVNGAGNGWVTAGTDVPFVDARIPSVGKIFAVYPGGKCYYRVNIQDGAIAQGISPLRYAVMRNYWYQISLTSFTNLGYPNPVIAAGKATDALAADTYVKSTINVKAWTKKEMKPEVGL